MSLYEQLQSDYDIYEVEPDRHGVGISFATTEEFIRYAKNHSAKELFHSVEECKESDIFQLRDEEVFSRIRERFLFFDIVDEYTAMHEDDALGNVIYDKLEKFNETLRKKQSVDRIETFSFMIDRIVYGVSISEGAENKEHFYRYDVISQFVDSCEKMIIKKGNALIKEANSLFEKMSKELEQDEKFGSLTSDSKRIGYARAYASEHDFDLYYLVADNSRKFRKCTEIVLSGKDFLTYSLYEVWEKNPYRTKKIRE